MISLLIEKLDKKTKNVIEKLFRDLELLKI